MYILLTYVTHNASTSEARQWKNGHLLICKRLLRGQLHKTVSVMQVFGCVRLVLMYFENIRCNILLLPNFNMFNVLHDSQRGLNQIKLVRDIGR